MTGISIDEIRDALVAAEDEAESVDSSLNDIRGAAADITEAARTVEDSASESLQAIRNALSMLDGWAEDQTEGIDPDDVQKFLQNTVSIIDRMNEFLVILRGNVFSFAASLKDNGIELKGE